MAVFKTVVNYYILCFICFKGIKSAKVYLIDVPYSDDELLKRYDDYDDPNDFDYKLDYIKKPENTIPISVLNLQTHKGNQEHKRVLANCHRVFGSLYDKQQTLRLCLESLNNKNTVRHKKSALKDMTNFSTDYLDVNDLARTQFADNYVDVGEFRNQKDDINDKCEYDASGKAKNCVLPSRKAIANNAKDKVEVQERASSSEGEEKYKKKKHKPKKYKPKKYKPKRYKPKRYQVISDKRKKHDSDDSDDIDGVASEHPVSDLQSSVESLKPSMALSDSDKSIESVDSDNSIESADSDNSIEVTTRKPYKNKLKMLEDDKFVYLQGNNYYPISSFRRRLPHFLPKRYHWSEDQYKNLGLFWFNGPKGIPVPPLF